MSGGAPWSASLARRQVQHHHTNNCRDPCTCWLPRLGLCCEACANLTHYRLDTHNHIGFLFFWSMILYTIGRRFQAFLAETILCFSKNHARRSTLSGTGAICFSNEHIPFQKSTCFRKQNCSKVCPNDDGLMHECDTLTTQAADNNGVWSGS